MKISLNKKALKCIRDNVLIKFNIKEKRQLQEIAKNYAKELNK